MEQNTEIEQVKAAQNLEMDKMSKKYFVSTLLLLIFGAIALISAFTFDGMIAWISYAPDAGGYGLGAIVLLPVYLISFAVSAGIALILLSVAVGLCNKANKFPLTTYSPKTKIVRIVSIFALCATIASVLALLVFVLT